VGVPALPVRLGPSPFGPVPRPFHFVNAILVAVAPMGAVLGLRRALPDHFGLSATILITPHSGFFAMQEIGQHRRVSHVGRRCGIARVYCAHNVFAGQPFLGLAKRSTLPENPRMVTSSSVRLVGWQSFALVTFPLMLALACSAAVQLGNGSVTSLIREGQSALDAGDFPRATSEFEQARRVAPENIEVNRGLLLSYLQEKRLDDAERLGQSAVAHWPQDTQLLHWLGLVYFKQQRNAKALEMLRRAEKLNGSQADIHFDMALVLLSDNQYPVAANELEKSTKLDPKAALPHVLLGRAYQNTNRSVQAVEQFKTALRLEPEIPLGHYHLGFAYASLGRNQEAIAEYQNELLRSPNDFSVLYQLGHCLLAAGDWKSAVTQLRKATEVDPQNADGWYDLGKALLLQGDAEGAVPALRRAIALKPGDPSAHYQLARALEKTGRKEEAQLELQTFSALKKMQPVAGGMATGPIQ
jgi:tetratricopeptide (TPR) repeat protein